MAYDEDLARRVRAAIGDRPGISERKMFGGLAFMCGGNMFIGVMGSEIMARVGAERHAECLARPGARVMDFTGRPMNGYLYVNGEGIASDQSLQSWVDQTYAFAAAMPAREPGTSRLRKKRA